MICSRDNFLFSSRNERYAYCTVPIQRRRERGVYQRGSFFPCTKLGVLLTNDLKDLLQHVGFETFLSASCFGGAIYQIPNGRQGQLSRGFTGT